MLLLAALGQRAAALRQFEAYERLLASEGLRPLDATAALIAQIRSSGNGSNGDAARARLPVELPKGAAANPAATPAEAPPSLLRKSEPRVVKWFGWATAAAATAALIAVVAVALTRQRQPKYAFQRIAVLPFANRTNDRQHDETARAIADLIAQTVARTGTVELVDVAAAPRTAGAQDRDPPDDDLARTLGASTLVQGTLYLEHSELVASARIVDASSGAVIHEVEPVRDDDLAQVMDDVRQRVAGALAAFSQPRFTAWQPRLSRPPRHDALVRFELGLDAAAAYRAGDARREFLAAAALDSTFAQAWLFAAYYSGNKTVADSLLRKASAQRDRLSEFDRLAVDREAHRQRAGFAEMYLVSRRLYELAPSSVETAWWLATAAIATNRFSEAIRVLHALPAERGWLEGASEPLWLDLDAHHYAGDFAREIGEMKQVRKLAESVYDHCYAPIRGLAALGRETSVDSLVATCLALPDARETGSAWLNVGLEYRAHHHSEMARRALLRAREWYAAASEPYHNTRVLAQIEWNLGNWQATIEQQRAVMKRVTPDARDYTRLGAAAARLGDTATANQMARQVASMGPFYIDQAIIAAALGKPNTAMEHLRSAIWNGAIPAVQFHRQPGLDPLRGYGPFDALLRPR